MTSRYGAWRDQDGLPVFDYTADHLATAEAEWDPQVSAPTRQHWSVVGNRAISLWAANDGTVALWDESDCLRWLTAPDPEGTGTSSVRRADGTSWGSAFVDRPKGSTPTRTFGPTWFTVTAEDDEVRLERTVLCPEGEVPWLLVRVVLTSRDGREHRVEHREQWRLRPRHCLLGTDAIGRRTLAEEVTSFEVELYEGVARATEVRAHTAPDVVDRGHLDVLDASFGEAPGASSASTTDLLRAMGRPRRLVLQQLRGLPARACSDGLTHPTLQLVSDVTVPAEGEVVLWARFGRDDRPPAMPPQGLFEDSLSALARRLPTAAAAQAPEAAEIPWHVALLTGAAAHDDVMGGHSLDQGSAYSYVIGVDAATRDVLQHALPLVYSEPDLALSVLRHCVARATPQGDLPYGLDAGKRPWSELFQPSDQNLYALWLAAEHLAATGDVSAYHADAPYHPVHGAEPVSLTEHLCRQFRFFVDEVGRGERGHVRMRNADWNDGAIGASGVPREVMIAKGESVLNSAFAAWVLPVWAGAADRLGRPDVAGEARTLAGELCDAVRESWNGRWFHRAYAPGADPVGDTECWLEPQPWAILSGAASPEQAAQLLDTVDRLGRAGSPLGSRALFGEHGPGLAAAAQQDQSQVWLALNGTLVWAAARAGVDWAWDEWRRMSLARHTSTYPHIWEGTLSGPDAWLGPEASRPGRTWSAPEAGISMQAFPVANAHAHAQPVLAYLRLLGVEPGTDGALITGRGGSFSSASFALEHDGHGHVEAAGKVTVRHAHGTTHGTGRVAW